MNLLARKRRQPISADRWITADARAYWLANAHGFRVDSPTRTLGVIEDVRLDEEGRLKSLLVAGGLLGSRSVVVEARKVKSVSPRLLRVCVEESTGPNHVRRASQAVRRHAADAGWAER